ncbi:tRNA (adenine-N1)-methyltransferase [Egicoccus halophilus]|uniref:tRNA (adenine(58)-N(1))-methyltransferase TrmI n=1 Tax=Egicoccus halophilus TaxID=1670830 RepID=A0A8J3EWY2_9ACTN|nr:tRNA (adenine-N1)-methyltransferase [Egicoccus halophilus]GGI04663.1 SAM-dependent methyltransferase [Egicoccus halophilus]
MSSPTAAAPLLPGTDAPLAAGELVVLIDRRRRRYLVELTEGGEWHSHAGLLTHDALIGCLEGTAVRTNRNMEIVVLRPTREDYVLKMKRGAQVVYPKDQAAIVAAADVRPGCTVVEAGAGSGALTLALLAAVGPTGRVVSFERRDDHAAHARRNVARFLGGEPDNWQLVDGDLVDGLGQLEERPHRLVLDLLEPWLLVPGAAQALPAGAIVLAYMPTVPQVMRFSEALWDDGRFTDVRTTETLVRPWDVDGLAVRPAHRMVAHTAFLTTARRVPARDEGGPPPPRRKADVGPGVVWGDATAPAAGDAGDDPVGDPVD